MVSERSQTKKAIYKIPEIDEINRNRMQIGGWQELGGRGNGQKLVHGFKVLLWGVRNVWELGVLAVWYCQGAQCH